jgi:hypothetical protein
MLCKDNFLLDIKVKIDKNIEGQSILNVRNTEGPLQNEKTRKKKLNLMRYGKWNH